MKMKAIHWANKGKCTNCKRTLRYAWYLNISGHWIFICNTCRDKLHMLIEDTLKDTAKDRYIMNHGTDHKRHKS